MDRSGNTRRTFATGAHLFVCALAIAHAAAFATFWIQARGLIGPQGILPAAEYFTAAHQQLGNRAWFEVPSLCWLFGAGRFIDILCCLGIALSVLLFLGVARAACLALLWAFYLSLMSAGQIFFDFQWDALLLESTLVAILLVPWTLGRARRDYDPPPLARFVVWWLLFRLMFLSGIVKLTSGDPTWRHMTALLFHYQTQPLPNSLAWYANLLPAWFQKLSCVVMFAIELAAPLCIPGPRRIRHAAALWLIFLQVVIALTGNYAFFNLVTIGLCLACLDDDWWRSIHWGVAGGKERDESPRSFLARAKPALFRWFAALYAGITFFLTASAVWPGARHSPIVRVVETAVGPLESFNNYGLFAVMTVERPELVIEGSDDGRDWREYTLPFKPGDLGRRPRWAAPLPAAARLAALVRRPGSAWGQPVGRHALRAPAPERSCGAVSFRTKSLFGPSTPLRPGRAVSVRIHRLGRKGEDWKLVATHAAGFLYSARGTAHHPMKTSGRDQFLGLLGEAVSGGSLVKLTLGKPAGKDPTLENLFVRPVTLKSGPRFAFVWRHATRDITKNHDATETLGLLGRLIGTDFLDAHLFTTTQGAQLETGSGTPRLKVRPLANAPAGDADNDRTKKRAISEKAPWLRALGVTDHQGRPAASMADKFRQIEKFAEILGHLVTEATLPRSRRLRVFDMGSGKGYLTFAISEMLQDRADVIGVETRGDLVDFCSTTAEGMGFGGRLSFRRGSIADTDMGTADVMIALHACDTATDDALFRGIAAGAALLVVSPCCQKELRPQLVAPQVLSGALRHGIFEERQAEFVTDALRAQLLEWAGYRTKVMEFVSTEHTAKNIMITAVKGQPKGGEASAERIRAFASFYGIRRQALASPPGLRPHMTWTELDWESLDRHRERFLGGKPSDGPYWVSDSDLAGYDLTFGERIGWKWDAVLDELTMRGWSPGRGAVLDWGCGSGIAGRRVVGRFGAGRVRLAGGLGPLADCHQLRL